MEGNLSMREPADLVIMESYIAKYSSELWLCSSCQSGFIESQTHVLFCSAYTDLRAGKDLNNDSDIIDYIRKVLIVRENLTIIK